MTTEEAKKEVVRKAYERAGFIWEQVKRYVDMDSGVLTLKSPELKYSLTGYNEAVSSGKLKGIALNNAGMNLVLSELKGIHNNNGWIRLEPDGSNLPKEKAEYWGMVLIQGKRQAAHVPFEPSSVMKSFWMKFVSHYQPIQKPEPPIY